VINGPCLLDPNQNNFAQYPFELYTNERGLVVRKKARGSTNEPLYRSVIGKNGTVLQGVRSSEAGDAYKDAVEGKEGKEGGGGGSEEVVPIVHQYDRCDGLGKLIGAALGVGGNSAIGVEEARKMKAALWKAALPAANRAWVALEAAVQKQTGPPMTAESMYKRLIAESMDVPADPDEESMLDPKEKVGRALSATSGPDLCNY
jgi:hypothetical protein